MIVTLMIRMPPARMPPWYPPQDPAVPHVYQLGDAQLRLVQRVLTRAGVLTGQGTFDGSVESCRAVARTLRELVADGRKGAAAIEELRTESLRNDLLHFGAFNAVAADCNGYEVSGDVPDLPADVLAESGADDSGADDDDVAPFADWAALRAWAAESYEIEDEGGDIFSFVVDWTDTERTQRVIVRPAIVQEEACAVFASFVARRHQVDPWLLLSRNLDDAFATFGLDDEGRILLACTFPLTLLSPGRFDAVVDVLASRADDAEQELTHADEF